MNNKTSRARELLAAEYEADRSQISAYIRDMPIERLNPPEQRALRAIDKALSRPTVAEQIAENANSLPSPLREAAQAVVDCYGVGWACDYQAFTKAVSPLILELRQALASPPNREEGRQ